MIVDCFPFFDELDLLEIRANELKDVVDVFVLTESPYTFTWKEKPLYYAENKDRFKDFNIISTVFTPKHKVAPMAFEVLAKQSNLDTCFDMMSKGDILAHGDADEIPRASVLKRALEEDWGAARMVMPLFYFFMNFKNTNQRNFKNTRLVRYTDRFEYIESQKFHVDRFYQDSGWHFSFLGNVQEKLGAYSHAPQYDKPPYNTPEHIQECMDKGLDLFMRKGTRRVRFDTLTDLHYLPQYVLENIEKFEKYIKT